MKKFAFVLMLVLSSFSYSQEGIENLLFASSSDTKKLMTSYLKPGFEGFLYSVNNGWYTTAKVYRKFGFEFSINLNAALIPYEDRFFKFNPSQYNSLTIANGKTKLPTIMNHDSEMEGAVVNVSIPTEGGNFKTASFTMPEGLTEDLPLKALPLPMIQLGFGLPFKTDVKFRFVPSLNHTKNDIEAGLIGLAIQHDLTHHFGVDYDDARFGLSVLGGFTNIDAKYNFFNEKLKNKNITVSDDAALSYSLYSWTVQLVGSMDYEHVSFYAAYGYNEAYSKLELEGNYQVTYDIKDKDGNTINTLKESVNPFDRLDFDETGTNRVTAGMSVKMADFFKMYLEYVFQEPYNSIGTGVSFFFK